MEREVVAVAVAVVSLAPPGHAKLHSKSMYLIIFANDDDCHEFPPCHLVAFG